MWASSVTNGAPASSPDRTPDSSFRCQLAVLRDPERKGPGRKQNPAAGRKDELCPLGPVHRLDGCRSAISSARQGTCARVRSLCPNRPECATSFISRSPRRAVILHGTAPLLKLAHRTDLERPIQESKPCRVPEGDPGPDVMEAEQVQLDAQPAVVPLLASLRRHRKRSRSS